MQAREEIMSQRFFKPIFGLLLVAACAERPVTESAGLAPLHRAARDGDLARVESLLDSGADLESRDRYERTALHWAATRGKAEVAKLLLDRGAAVDARAWYDMRPLHWASMRGHAAVVRLLLERGADPNAASFHRITPLHLAGTAEVARLLLASGADLHALDVRGMTPMHLSRTEEVAQALVNDGANLGIQARDGRRPFDMTMAANDGPERVVIYPAAPQARLRGDEATFDIVMMNLSEAPIRNLHTTATSPAVQARVEPVLLAALHPAQIQTYTLYLQRTLGVAPDEYTLLVTMTEGDRELAQFDVELDTRHEVTPADRGLIQVAQVELRPPLSTWQYIAFVSPLLLLVAAWALRRWLGRRTQA